jgi:hypothetical protein
MDAITCKVRRIAWGILCMSSAAGEGYTVGYVDELLSQFFFVWRGGN